MGFHACAQQRQIEASAVKGGHNRPLGESLRNYLQHGSFFIRAANEVLLYDKRFFLYVSHSHQKDVRPRPAQTGRFRIQKEHAPHVRRAAVSDRAASTLALRRAVVGRLRFATTIRTDPARTCRPHHLRRINVQHLPQEVLSMLVLKRVAHVAHQMGAMRSFVN